MESGYPLSIFRGKHAEAFLCRKCRLILRRPVQITCGHRFCENCWHRIIGGSATAICPECPENGDTLVQAHPDNGLLRDMNNEIVHCPSPNCSWSGSFNDFQVHEQDLSGRHDDFQFIGAILTMFCTMLLSLYFINQAKAMLREASQLQRDTLESLSDRIRAVEEARYGGILIWKITNIGSRIRDAVSGRVKVLLSPDLYTNVQGKESYKMKVLLYPNGAEKHMSLYFEAIEGPMDALMKWPFDAKVTVKFLDQAGQVRVHETFRASFNRPGSSGSVSRHGFSKFLSQSPLLTNDGARGSPDDEDSVFIEIKVEDERQCYGKESKASYNAQL